METVDRGGNLRRRPAADYTPGYRQVAGPEGEAFVAATWSLPADDPEALRAWIRRMLDARNATQPVGEATCGSVFRNPPGDAAGRLIEAAGLKGAREGGAYVSQLHANFIINDGGTAADIERLMERVRERVAASSGVRLEPEVHIVGEGAP